MASMTLQAATSSSTPRWRYDVFLNFRGEDTRESFTDHLYAALIEKGLVVFRDNEKLERGKDISQELWKAIQESQYAVVVVSTNYAFSKWCLRELTKILECRSEVRLTVLPVFYHVDPSEVRNQKGSFAEAFAKHIDDSQVGEEQIKRWRAALKEVGNLAGWHIRDRSEATIVKEICGNIVNGLNYNLPNISQGLVGIESRVKEVMTLLCISTDGKDDVRCVGICGMGGIGKTTLAKTVYESVSSFPLSSFFPFDAHCFIADVKDKTRKKGLEYVQEQLISKILSDTQIKIWDDYEGSNVIAKRACQKRVFVVLDDIDETKQLEALAKSRSWFAQGSRIIVTSRNRSLFNTVEYDVCSTFEVELLNDNEALQLFSLKAFKKNYPEENFVELSKDIVKIAAGLPLALEVFGASLYKKDINKWESTRDLLKARSQAEVLKKLEISFDGLELDLQRELFLDIACFFNGKKVDNVMDMLDRFDYHPRINIDVLEEKSLLKIKNGQFWMHELLEQMGKEIVYCENSKKPGKRSRLWHPKDVVEVLNHDTGTDAIETIFLELAPRKFKQINFEAFSKMINLRMLEVSYKDNDDDLHVMKWYGDPTKLKLSDKLCAMEWFGYPLEYLPTNFQPKNLVELKISHSCIKQLWGGSLGQFEYLKHIDLSYSQHLLETPDFSGVPQLEILRLLYCTNLFKVHSSIGSLKQLKDLSLKGSNHLQQLSDVINLPSLTNLDLRDCSKLKEFPKIEKDMPSLKNLSLRGTAIQELPSSFEKLLGLTYLCLFNCSRFKEIPESLVGLECLEKVYAQGTAIRQLPSSIRFMKKLKVLYVGSANSNPINFLLTPLIFDLRSLEELNISYRNLSDEALPSDLGGLSSLEILDLSGNKLTRIPDGVYQLSNLDKLYLRYCSNIQALEKPLESHLRSLRILDLSYCGLLDGAIPNDLNFLSSLECLYISGNKFTKLPDSICQLSNLEELYLDHCNSVQVLPKLPLGLGYLYLNNCPLLETLYSQIVPRTSSEMLLVEGCSIVAFYFGCNGKPYMTLHLHPLNPIWSVSNDQRVEDMVAWGPTRGSKIPDWFNWRTTSLSGSIQSRIDLTSDGVLEVWWGCVLFIVYEVHEFGSCQRKRQKQNFNEDGNSDSRIFDGSNPTSPKFDCQLQVNENGPKISLVFCVPEVLSTGLNGAWMFIKLSCFGEPQRDLNRWNYLGASIITNNLNVEVKECGAHLVRYYDLSETAKELSRISLHSLDSESLKSLCSSSIAVLGPIKGKD